MTDTPPNRISIHRQAVAEVLQDRGNQCSPAGV